MNYKAVFKLAYLVEAKDINEAVRKVGNLLVNKVNGLGCGLKEVFINRVQLLSNDKEVKE